MLIASSPRLLFVQRMDRFVLEYHIRQFGTKQLARRNLNQLCKSVTRLAPNNPRIKASEFSRMRVSRGGRGRGGGRGGGGGGGEGDGEEATKGEEEISPGGGGAYATKLWGQANRRRKHKQAHDLPRSYE